MITKLTPAQEKRLGEAYNEWLAVGRSCAPLDRKEATDIVGEFYARIGKPKPRVLFFSSPIMCVLAYGVLKNTPQLRGQLGGQLRDQLGGQLRDQLWGQLGGQLWDQLRGQLWDQLRGQLWGQLRDQLGGQLRDQLGGQLRDQLGGQLRDQLWDQLWGQLGGQLWGQLWDQLGDQLWDQLNDQLWGQLLAGNQWCAWEVFYAFCGEIGVRYKADQTALLDLWLRQSRGLHWWFPYEGIVLASERHTSLHVDDRGRLHHPTELACAYSDGWGIYAWHGTRMPEEYCTKPVTATGILAERNAEVRRALIERYGQDRFILDAGARIISKAPQAGSNEDNELIALDLPEDPDGRMVCLKLRCPSTNAVYIIRVPPQMKTVREALAWSYGFEKPEQYAPLVET